MRVRIFGLAAIVFAIPLIAAEPSPAGIEQRFDAAINPKDLDAWLKRMSAGPNHVGSPHNKANAEWQLAEFKRFGWDAHIETFEVLYPTPLQTKVELLAPKRFSATLTERAVPGDETSKQVAKELPAYVAYQGDGDVTAPLVYVNYGMPDDYTALERMGVSVEGKIVIARYGAGWRGLKPKLAQDHGAVGCIIYSDPRDDGYSTDEVYPKGPARPPQGVQRGSVAEMPLFPGDPLTPGVAATKDAKRLTRAEAPTLLKIPTLPISYGDAEHFLAALGGHTAPGNWRGSLPITYRVGGDDDVKVHLLVKSDWSLKTIYNVVAKIEGSTYPDQWILRGNHRDGWVFGANDPLSGQIALMAEVQAIGKLVAGGWRPKRTLVYLSWDAEEPGLIGSTEWAEAHAAELKKKALIYINTDSNERGMLSIGGSPAFQHLVNEVAGDLTDPETKASVGARWRAAARVAATASDASPRAKAVAAIAADPKQDMPIEALGSGSDYSAFLQHLGIAALDVSYGGESPMAGVYHSAYDSYTHYTRFVDPGFSYGALLAKTIGRLVLRLADAELPAQRYTDAAETIGRYLDEVKKLADTRRETASTQAQLLKSDLYRLADDPTKSRGNPKALQAVPFFNFAPLENAVARLRRSAQAFDAALEAKGQALSPAAKASVFELTRQIEQTLTHQDGLPLRPWYRNLVFAPGRFTGYGAKTLPGVREAIEEERWTDVDRYAGLTAQVLANYSDKLDEATRIVTGE